MGIGASLSVLLVVFLVLLKAMVYSWTTEDSIILRLQMARQQWMEDDCPGPADRLKYVPRSSGFTGSVYTASLVVKDPG